MSQSLNNLPDLCLLAVFQYLSLLELFGTIRLVSTRWSSLLPTELNRRRSLVITADHLSQLQLDNRYQSLLIEHVRRDDGLTPWARLPHIDHSNVLYHNYRYTDGDDNHDDNRYHPIHNQVPPEMTTTLVGNLPRITHLTMVQQFIDISALDQIVRMIDHWHKHLVSLKLYLDHEFILDYDETLDEHNAQLRSRTIALFDSINRSTFLKHLKLKMNEEFFNIDPPFTPSLTILSQLSTFHIDSQEFEKYLNSALIRYASNNNDLSIATSGWEYSLDTLLGIDKQFCDKFINVEVDTNLDTQIEDVNLFCSRFTSLVNLNFWNENISITKLARCLSQLTQLVHLYTHARPHSSEENLPEQQQELSLDQIVPVPSVRLLTLRLFIKSHHSTEQLLLPELFPNVQVLSLESYTKECPDCGFNVNEERGPNEGFGPQMRLCAQLARRQFRRFPRLHTIEIDQNDSVLLFPPKGFSRTKFITLDEL